MKIAIPVTGNDINSNVDMRFGRATGFLLTDESANDVQYIQNPGFNQAGGAGIATAQFLADQGAQAVICGNIGPNAFNALKAGNLKIFQINSAISAKEALDRLRDGNVKEVTAPTGPAHAGMGRGMGRSGGRGGSRRQR